MGRYDRDSGRYTKTRGKGNGLSVTVTGLLIFAAALGGFFARPYVEENTQPIRDLLGLIDNPPALPAPTPETTNSVKATETPPTLEPLQAPPAPIILPELASSDGEFRKAVTSSAPELAQWLNSESLIRKFMTIANDVSQSQRINKHFEFLKLPQRFTPGTNSEGLFMDAESQHRYDRLATAIAEADTTGLVTTYQIFKPLLQQVYQEFSYPDEFPLDAMLRKAGAEIMAAPIIEGPIPLTKNAMRYPFADPQLEALNPVRKQMLRMGPENTRLIQEKIKALLEKLAEPPTTP
jgi:hypothetical protein